MAQRPPTIGDVARRSGRSTTTVSRVLNRTGFVSPEARVAIEDAIRELGYVPSASARGLAGRQTGMIGILLPDSGATGALPEWSGDDGVTVRVDPPAGGPHPWGSQYFGEVLRGAEFAAWEAGLAITVAMSRGPDLESRMLGLASRVDGLVVVTEALDDDLLARIAERVPAITVVAGLDPIGPYDKVTVANAAGMRHLVAHLLEDHGVRRPEYVGGPAGAPDDEDRFDGYRAALAAAGLPVPREPRWRADFTRATARTLAARVLDAGELPEAIVCCNDETALGFLDVLSARGVRVPDDVLLTGFDGAEAAVTSAPPITTVAQPMADLGRVAVEVLTRRLADPTRRAHVERVPVTVLLRSSCGEH